MDHEDSSILDQVTPEELLSPIIKMERYMQSDIIVNRYVVVFQTRSRLPHVCPRPLAIDFFLSNKIWSVSFISELSCCSLQGKWQQVTHKMPLEPAKPAKKCTMSYV